MIKDLIWMKVKMPNLDGKNPILMVQLWSTIKFHLSKPYAKTEQVEAGTDPTQWCNRWNTKRYIKIHHKSNIICLCSFIKFKNLFWVFINDHISENKLLLAEAILQQEAKSSPERGWWLKIKIEIWKSKDQDFEWVKLYFWR